MKANLLVALVIAMTVGQSAGAKMRQLPEDRTTATRIIQIELQLNDQSSSLSESQRQALEVEQEQLVTKIQSEDSAGYETLRSELANQAPNVEAFAKWATAEELAQDANITEDEVRDQMIEKSGTGAAIRIFIHIGSQTITTSGGGLENISGHRIATARPGFRTPLGCRQPTTLDKKHWSRKYNAPMANSVFFNGGVALHQGAVNVRSHGCVHLTGVDSAEVFRAIQLAGRGNTRICVVQ